MSEPSVPNLREAFFRGAAWVMAIRWATKLLGLTSTAILARLLTPADFGLVAMAMLVVGFFQVWFDVGLEIKLIQNRRAGRDHYDTAWTFNVIQCAILGTLLAIAAPFAAHYFREPRLAAVIWTLSVIIVIIGFGNIGIVMLRKELRFEREFLLQITGKLAQFAAVVAAAYILRNYWALVIGVATGYLMGLILSYLGHPYRPRFSLAKARELWAFSKTMVLRSVGIFAESRADEIVVGRLSGAADLGLYSISSELGQLPGSELAAPLNRALMPTLAKMQGEPGRLRAAFGNFIGTIGSLTVPAGVGLALVAPQAVPVLLGSGWLAAVPILQILAFYGVVRSLFVSTVEVFLATGRPGATVVLAWTSLACFLALAWPGFHYLGLEGIALAKLGAGVLVLGMAIVMVTRTSAITARDFAARLARPLLATFVMSCVVTALPDLAQSTIATLVAKVAAGAVVYGIALTALWRLSGSPDGAERVAFGYAVAALAKFRAWR